MGMFDNYNNNNNTNINTSFTPNPFAPQYPPVKTSQQIIQNNPNKPYEVVDSRGNLTGYFWYYGNSIELVWDIIGEATYGQSNQYINVSDVVAYNTIIATIYDWRHQIIEKIKLLPNIVDDNVTVTLPINGDLSQKLVKGVYTISLTMSNNQGYNETLFDTNVCNFEVR